MQLTVIKPFRPAFLVPNIGRVAIYGISIRPRTKDVLHLLLHERPTNSFTESVIVFGIYLEDNEDTLFGRGIPRSRFTGDCSQAPPNLKF